MGCSILLQAKNFLKGINLDRYQRVLPMLMVMQLLLYSNRPSPETKFLIGPTMQQTTGAQ